MCGFLENLQRLLSGYWVAIEWLLSGYWVAIESLWIVIMCAWITQTRADCDAQACAQVLRWSFKHDCDSWQRGTRKPFTQISLLKDSCERSCLYQRSIWLSPAPTNPSTHLRWTLRFCNVFARNAFGSARLRRRTAERFFFPPRRAQTLLTTVQGYCRLCFGTYAASTCTLRQTHTDKRIHTLTLDPKSLWIISYIDMS